MDDQILYALIGLTPAPPEKSRKFLHKRKREEQKPSKGCAAQVAAGEEWGPEPGAEEETVVLC
jgi:hypothetical protein